MPFIHRSLLSSLLSCLCLLFFVLCPLYPAYAELPDIPVAIEGKLYQGSPEEITAFIDKRQEQVNDFIAQITARIQTDQQGKEEPTQLAFTSLLDLFQGLSFQLKTLKAELVRPDMPPLLLPAISSPPYSLEIFDDIIAFQHKATQQLGLYEEMQAYGMARIASIDEELTTLLPQYAQEKGDAGGKMSAYEKLAYILTMQHEYALLQLKKPKINTAFAETQGVVKEAGLVAEKVFNQLRISKEDVAEQKKKLKTVNADLVNNMPKASFFLDICYWLFADLND